MTSTKLTAEQLDLLTRDAMLRRNLEAARIEKRVEGIRYCYREIIGVEALLAASGYRRP